MKSRYPGVALVMLAGALAVTGCGSSASDHGSGAVVSVSGAAGAGPLLVDGKEGTLYEFSNDKGGKSACYGDCSSAISPLLTKGTPQAEGGAMAAKLGTTQRKDGTTQVTYAGHPLYIWREEPPGEARGRGVDVFEGRWFALRPSGKPVAN
jgi:predicted lipoprotein with Yx(FWY)xxD motif